MKHTVLNLKAIVAQLAIQGITKVEITYSGGGDSGDFNDITFTPDLGNKETTVEMISQRHVLDKVDGKWVSVTSKINTSMDICTAVEDLTWHQVNSHFGGWENNEGGGGTMTINVAEGTATLSHYNYVEKENSVVDIEIDPAPHDETNPIGAAVHKVQMLLSQRGQDSVTVCFYGYGDGGAIEDVSFVSKSDQAQPIDLDGVFEEGMSLRNFIYDLTENCISDNGMEGYENDGGGGGILTIPATGNARFEGFYKYEESEEQSVVLLSIHDAEEMETEGV